MTAAISAKRAGLERVVVLERAETLGGVLHQCVHNGFGLHYYGEDLTGPEYAHRLIEEARFQGVEFFTDTMVLSLSGDRGIRASSKTGLLELEPGAVVLGMGCRERTRGAIRIPGLRPSGVYTAGVAQRLVNIEGYLPGGEVVILGSGDIGMIMARRLTLEGARVKAVLEVLPYVSGLIRNQVQCLEDYGIPLWLSHTVTFVHGIERVSGVTVSQVDEGLKPVPGTDRFIECDTLLLSVGLIPENELSRVAGVAIDPLTGGPLVDERRQTSIPGVFACGNVLHVHDLVDNASVEAQIAGQNAAAFAGCSMDGSSGCLEVKAGRNVRYVVPQKVYPNGTDEVAFWLRVTRPMTKVVFQVGGANLRLPFVRPSEMVTLRVSRDEIRALRARGSGVTIDCEPRHNGGEG